MKEEKVDVQEIEKNSKIVDEELDDLESQSEIEKIKYAKQMKRYETYNKVMRYSSFALCIVATVACVVGGICMIAIDLGVGAIVAGVIMLVIAPIIGLMLSLTLYFEKHPEKLKEYITKRANKMRAKQQKKEERKKNKGNK